MEIRFDGECGMLVGIQSGGNMKLSVRVQYDTKVIYSKQENDM